MSVGIEAQPAAAPDVRMYDIGHDRWTRVVGLPDTPGRFHSLSYVTADGFAVAAEEHAVATSDHSDVIVLSSIEGRLDNEGRFVQPRPVPVGSGLWSPDRSLVVEQRLEGVAVRSATDLRVQRLLRLPVDQFRVHPTAILQLNLQWESPHEVLVTRTGPDRDQPVYRCDVGSGACTIIDRDGTIALGNNSPQPG